MALLVLSREFDAKVDRVHTGNDPCSSGFRLWKQSAK